MLRLVVPTLIAALLTSGAALAQPAVPTTLEQAVAKARERFNGRVLAAETQPQAGRRIHVIRILTPDGRVKNLRVDAATGRFEEPASR